MNILVDRDELLFIKKFRLVGFVNELAKRVDTKPQSITRYFNTNVFHIKQSIPEQVIKEARKLLKEQTGLTYTKQK